LGKHTASDFKLTSNSVAPDPGFVRLKANSDGHVRYIFEDGSERHIASPWELPVTDYTVTDPASLTPVLNQRYLVPAGAVNDWAGHDEQIATWNGSAWEFQTASEGWAVYNKTPNSIYTFDGSVWNEIQASGSGPASVGFTMTFTDTNLVSGVLNVTHNLGALNNVVHVTIRDNNGRYILATDVNFVSDNVAEVDLSAHTPLTGTWALTAGLGGDTSTLTVNVLHSELLSLMGSAGLVPGSLYRITDYQTIHTIQNTATVNTGPIEELVVKAVSSSDISLEAFSSSYPTDRIYYDANNTNGGTRPGFIVYRKDLSKNIEKGYDFRAVKFRRWAIDMAAIAYDSAHTYNQRDSVSYNNILYYSIKGSNLNNLPTDTNYWMQLTPDLNGYYVMTSSTSVVMTGNTSIPSDSSDFRDYYAFSSDNAGVIAYYAPTDVNNISQDTVLNDFDNNVIIAKDGIDSRIHNTYWAKGFVGNTFIDTNINRTEFGNEGYLNVFVGANVDECKISTGFSYNWVTGSIRKTNMDSWVYRNCFRNVENCSFGPTNQNNYFRNVYSSDFKSRLDANIFASTGFTRNSVGHNCRRNLIEGQFYNNIIGNNFEDNETTSSNQFYKNTILGDCSFNYFGGTRFSWNPQIGNEFQHNNLFGSVQWVTTGHRWQSNTVNGHIYRSEFGYLCDNNVINDMNAVKTGSHFRDNTITGSMNTVFANEQFHDNSLVDMSNCEFFGEYSNNDSSAVGSSVSNCTITAEGKLIYATITGNFLYNTFKAPTAGFDFSSATHVGGQYNCEIFVNSGSLTPVLMYHNAGNVQTFTAVDA